MAAIIEEKDRRVIPNWRSFETTVSLGELNAISKRSYEVPTLSIDSYIRDYQNNKSIPYAADLLMLSKLFRLFPILFIFICFFVCCNLRIY